MESADLSAMTTNTLDNSKTTSGMVRWASASSKMVTFTQEVGKMTSWTLHYSLHRMVC